MRQREILTCAKKYCPNALRIVQTGSYAIALPGLTAAEKAFIFHHTDEGFETLNAALHASGGAKAPALARCLAASLRKLPPHRGLVYSGAQLSAAQLTACHQALALADTPAAAGATLGWPAFLSASLSRLTAQQFLSIPGKNCLLLITSNTGRLIETVSRHGASEREVLFLPNIRFRVTSIRTMAGYTEIVLAEA